MAFSFDATFPQLIFLRKEEGKKEALFFLNYSGHEVSFGVT